MSLRGLVATIVVVAVVLGVLLAPDWTGRVVAMAAGAAGIIIWWRVAPLDA